MDYMDYMTTIEKLKKRILTISMPQDWLDDGVEQINDAALNKAFNICKELYVEYDIVPCVITPSIEVAVFIKYKNDKDICVTIEVYNNLNTTLIVCDDKEILYFEDIKNMNFKKALSSFLYKEYPIEIPKRLKEELEPPTFVPKDRRGL